MKRMAMITNTKETFGMILISSGISDILFFIASACFFSFSKASFIELALFVFDMLVMTDEGKKKVVFVKENASEIGVENRIPNSDFPFLFAFRSKSTPSNLEGSIG